MATPTQHLADVLLAEYGGLAAYVNDRRAKGASWRRIALDLRDLTDARIDITHETLRTWFPDDVQPAAPSEAQAS